MSAIYDLYIQQGSTFSQELDMNVDCTGFTIEGKISDSIGETSVNIATWTDDTLGQFTIGITADITSSLSEGMGYYDIEVTGLDSTVSKPIKGRVYVDKEITI